MELQTFENTNDYVKAGSESIAKAILEALEKQKTIRVALSGGRSPIPVYEALAEISTIPWNRVNLFLVDERYVPLNSNESNFKMIKTRLVDKVKNLRQFYHYNTRDPIKTIVDQYQKTLQQFEKPLFDLVVLGLGEDGHIASLFPKEAALEEMNRLVVHTKSPDINTQDRMSLTFPALLNSKKIIFLIAGRQKQDALNQLLAAEESMQNLPATYLLGHSDINIFYSPNV